MAKAEDKSVVELLKAYASAERRIQAAASWRACTVKQYQEHLAKVVNDAEAILNNKNRAFGMGEIDKAHQEGQKQTDGASPQRHGHFSRKEADAILRKAGFRYSAKEFGYDTYIELQSATQAAGAGFLERVNKTVEDLKRRGQDTIYNVTQAIQKDIEAQGLLNVEYSNGRKTSISAYARMAARSARMESQNIGAFGRALENGTDYVRCTTIYPTCEICAKYQGRIYCISGRDKRFPALFETALRHGYALIHPNCRHEFIPVWLELMDENELQQAIEQSRIPSGDTRTERERNAYADWQDKNRRYYNERLYFEQAKLRLGPSMPYKDIGAFRRSYHAREGSLAHERSHNLIRDHKDYTELKQVLRGNKNLPKTLADFQTLRYNNREKYYSLLVAKAIREGRQPIRVEEGKQGKHILKHNNHTGERSYLAPGTTVEQIQYAVDKYAGSGRVEIQQDGNPSRKENIKIPELTGYVVDKNTGNVSVTHVFKIHYSNKGVHVVPKKERKE